MKFSNRWFIRNGLRWSWTAVAMALLIPGLPAQSPETDDAWAEIQVSASKATKAAAGSAEKVTIYRLDAVRFDGYLRSAPTEGSGAPALFVKLPMPRSYCKELARTGEL